MNAYDALVILKNIRSGTVVASWLKDLDKVIKWLEEKEAENDTQRSN